MLEPQIALCGKSWTFLFTCLYECQIMRVGFPKSPALRFSKCAGGGKVGGRGPHHGGQQAGGCGFPWEAVAVIDMLKLDT